MLLELAPATVSEIHPIFPANGEVLYGPLGKTIIRFEAAVFKIAAKALVLGQEVVKGLSYLTFRRN